MILSVVRKQLEAEIAEDHMQVELLLRDPSIADHEKTVAYTIHELYHHLAVHEKALELVNRKIAANNNVI